MPHVTSGNRRMTNVKLANGDIVQGIRKTGADDERDRALKEKLDPSSKNFNPDEALASMKPLRYTPGLKCDPHLSPGV